MSATKHTHPALMWPLILPYGVSFGYVSVALTYIATHHGCTVEQASALVASAFAPHAVKFLWAPVVDTTLSKKAWYLIGLGLTAGGTVASATIPIDQKTIGLVTVVVVAAQVGLTLLNMAVETFLGALPDTEKGRASGFYQAGAAGGMGVGGGAALWLSEKLPASWMVGAIVGGAMLACGVTLRWIDEPPKIGHGLAEAMRALGRDLKAIALSRVGLAGLVLALSPVGAGAASTVFPALADAWHVSEDLVALVQGVIGGVVAAIGGLAGGWLADRVDRRVAYALAGGLTALSGVVMALAPHTASAYVVLTLFYGLFNGMAAGAFTALVMETIGRGAVATKYNIFASLANFATSYTIRIEGRAHTELGPNGLLYVDAALTAGGIVMLFGLLQLLRPRRTSTASA